MSECLITVGVVALAGLALSIGAYRAGHTDGWMDSREHWPGDFDG